MRILLSTVHYPVAASRFLFWALRRMGHDTLTIGPAVGPWLPWAEQLNLEPIEWKPDIALPYEHGKIMQYDVDAALERFGGAPDLIIQMDAHFIMRNRPKCRNVLYAIDNHVAKYGAYEDFDRLYIAHSWGHMAEQPHAEFLPCAHDPAHHYNLGWERTIDVAVAGVAYGPRMDLVARLGAAGVRVRATTGALYSDYNALYNRAKIALVRSVSGDVAMRVFENMAQGCLVVADRARDMERCGFVEGVHYLGYDTPVECVDTVRHALAHWDEMRPIIAAGQDAAAAHTWQARAERMLEG